MIMEQTSDLLIIKPERQKFRLLPPDHPLLFSEHFDQILQKRGVLCFDSEDENVLRNFYRCNSYKTIVLLASSLMELPPDSLEALRDFSGSLIIEGPVPEALKELLKIRSSKIHMFERFWLQAESEEVREQLLQSFIPTSDPSLSNKTTPLEQPDSLPVVFPSYETGVPFPAPPCSLSEWGRNYCRLIEIYSYVMERKAERYKRFGNSLANDILVFIGILKNNLPINHFPQIHIPAVIESWIRTTRNQPASRLELGLLRALIGSMEELPEKEAFNRFYNESLEACSDFKSEGDFWQSWAIGVRKDIRKFLYRQISHPLSTSEFVNRIRALCRKTSPENNLTYQVLRNWYLLIVLEKQKVLPASRESAKLRSRLKKLQMDIEEFLPEFFIQPELNAYITLAAICSELNLPDAAQAITTWSLKHFQDPKSLLLWRTPEKARVELSGWVLVLLGMLRDTLLSPEMQNWPTRKESPEHCFRDIISKPVTIPVQAVEGTSGESLFSLRDPQDNAIPAIIRKDNTIITLFPLFSLLASYMAVPRMDSAFLTMLTSEYTHRLEDWVCSLLVREITSHGGCLPLICPWPENKAYCVNIRRDVDRDTCEEDLANLLEKDHALGLRSSWYWLSSNYNPDQIRRVEKANFENGWHAERWYRQHDTPTYLQSLLKPENRVLGATVHGGVSSDGWRGGMTLDAYEKAGIVYSDFPGSLSFFPYRGMVWDHTGLSLRDIVVMPVSTAYEKDAETVLEDKVLHYLEMAKKANGMFTMLHHPDLQNTRVLETLDKIGRSGEFISMTLLETARWWQKTHDRRFITLETKPHAEGIELIVHNREPIEKMVLQVFTPTGQEVSVNSLVPSQHWFQKGSLMLQLNLQPGKHTIPIALSPRRILMAKSEELPPSL